MTLTLSNFSLIASALFLFKEITVRKSKLAHADKPHLTVFYVDSPAKVPSQQPASSSCHVTEDVTRLFQPSAIESFPAFEFSSQSPRHGRTETSYLFFALPTSLIHGICEHNKMVVLCH